MSTRGAELSTGHIFKKKKKNLGTCYQEESTKPARLSSPNRNTQIKNKSRSVGFHRLLRGRVSLRGLNVPANCNNSSWTPLEPPGSPSPSSALTRRHLEPLLRPCLHSAERVGLPNFSVPTGRVNATACVKFNGLYKAVSASLLQSKTSARRFTVWRLKILVFRCNVAYQVKIHNLSFPF